MAAERQLGPCIVDLLSTLRSQLVVGVVVIRLADDVGELDLGVRQGIGTDAFDPGKFDGMAVTALGKCFVIGSQIAGRCLRPQHAVRFDVCLVGTDELPPLIHEGLIEADVVQFEVVGGLILSLSQLVPMSGRLHVRLLLMNCIGSEDVESEFEAR